MSTTYAIAGMLIVAVASMAGPLLLARLTLRRWDAEAERQAATAQLLLANQSAVAEKAAEVAERLLERGDAVAAKAAEAARLLLAANERVAETAAIANTKLDVIHILVNSQMTAAIQSELDATVRELAMMNEVVALHKAEGRDPSPEALAAIEATATKIRELRDTLAERLRQTELAEAQERDLPPGPP